MAKQTIYTVGGTVQASGGIYIKRKADDELLELCRAGELAFILSSRQVGKSSLMIRTAQQLEKEDIRSVTIDLSAIGVNVTYDEWYLGILNEIATSLKLETDIFAWWTQYAGLGPAQRFFNFLRDVLLKEVKDNIVLFFDEIDSTLSIPFADDFFASLRAVYNARSTTPDFKRLCFVLVGVATPSDLISDSQRTPFNIGQRVDLNDFTLEEALPLAQGLGENAEQTLALIFDWSGGHPYLTQRLCEYLSKSSDEIDRQTVAEAAHDLFLGEQGQQDNNLQFVRDMLVKRSPDARKVMLTYMDIRSGKKVADDERSVIKAHLKISGVVLRHEGRLMVRNRIYERAFDLAWVKENTPPIAERRFVVVSSLVTVVALMIAAFFAYQYLTQSPADRFELGFLAAKSSQERLTNLAGLFKLEGEENAIRARNLFLHKLSQEQQLELFAPVSESSSVRNQEVVARGIYQTLGFRAEADESVDKLLAKIRDSNSIRAHAPELSKEVDTWIQARADINKKDFAPAAEHLGDAIAQNPKNTSLYYDRARAFIGMGESNYPDALQDLNQMVQQDLSRSAAARRLIDSTAPLKSYWEVNKQHYPVLAEAVTIKEVLIPAGEFTMGNDTDAAYAKCREYRLDCSRDWFQDEEPPHPVYVDAFYIDTYEVTNARYAECVQEGSCKLPENFGSSTQKVYYFNPDYTDYPVIYVSWFDANTYCAWRGARLPTEAEWEKAARGTTENLYPWGNNIDCNYANYDSCVGDTTKIGSHKSGLSPYGVYDMSGNVWEWVADWYSGTYYSSAPFFSNPLGPASSEGHVLRGGPWNGSKNTVRSANRGRRDPAITAEYIGFRCARDGPP